MADTGSAENTNRVAAPAMMENSALVVGGREGLSTVSV
jgi:hypothetical protein